MNYKESLHNSCCLTEPGTMYYADYNPTMWNVH